MLDVVHWHCTKRAGLLVNLRLRLQRAEDAQLILQIIMEVA